MSTFVATIAGVALILAACGFACMLIEPLLANRIRGPAFRRGYLLLAEPCNIAKPFGPPTGIRDLEHGVFAVVAPTECRFATKPFTYTLAVNNPFIVAGRIIWSGSQGQVEYRLGLGASICFGGLLLSIASFLVWALLTEAASPAVSVALLALPLVIIAGFYRVWRNQALKKARALASSIAQEVSGAA